MDPQNNCMSYGKKKINLIYEDLTYKINRVLFDTHNQLGRFAREKQVGDLLAKKFKEYNLKFEREVQIGNSGNIADFILESKVILEIKGKPFLLREDYYQVQRYLKETNIGLGILVNFRSPYIKPHRILPPLDKP